MPDSFVLAAMAWLIVKHFVFDFTSLQTPWMFLNKGRYGHPGGLVHSLLHALASAPALLYLAAEDGWWLVPEMGLVGKLLLFEFLVHYHMDWLKVKLAFGRGWSGYVWSEHTGSSLSRDSDPYLAIYSNKYFSLLGVDQLIHYLTYVLMVWAWVGG